MNPYPHRACLAGLFTLLLIVGSALRAAPPAGEVRGGVYRYPALGWSMPVPDGWRVRDAAEVTSNIDRGHEMFEEALDAPIELDQIELLHMIRSKSDTFTSCVERIDPADGSIESQRQGSIDALVRFYQHIGARERHIERSERVGGVRFTRVDFVFLDAAGNEAGLQQALYIGVIDGRFLITGLTTSDPDARTALFAAWRASRFAPAKAVAKP